MNTKNNETILNTNGNGRPIRIVMTGGPGGGKTSVCDIIRRELDQSVALVPEAATMLFEGGFPRANEPKILIFQQQAIYQVQTALESSVAQLNPGKVILCDRGTIDGCCYWPQGPDDFFKRMGTTLQDELDRYDGVIFFESAAVGGLAIRSNNRQRKENTQEARALDLSLRKIWQQHPHFRFVPHSTSFFEKLMVGLSSFKSLMAELNSNHQPTNFVTTSDDELIDTIKHTLEKHKATFENDQRRGSVKRSRNKPNTTSKHQSKKLKSTTTTTTSTKDQSNASEKNSTN